MVEATIWTAIRDSARSLLSKKDSGGRNRLSCLRFGGPTGSQPRAWRTAGGAKAPEPQGSSGKRGDLPAWKGDG